MPNPEEKFEPSRPGNDQSGEKVSCLEARAFRDVVGLYASGITIIAGHDDDGPIGFTCQSFHSVSLTPPLISFNVMANSVTYPRIRKTGKFSVNVLSASQAALSARFARKGENRWAEVDWAITPGLNPALAGALTWLDCQIEAEHQAGDHLIVVGQVLTMSAAQSGRGEPLLYFRGQYRRLHLDSPPQ